MNSWKRQFTTVKEKRASCNRIDVSINLIGDLPLERRLRNGVFGISQFEQTYFPVRCDFRGRIGVVGLRYAIAGVCLR